LSVFRSMVTLQILSADYTEIEHKICVIMDFA
jgi:hypothetical protein